MLWNIYEIKIIVNKNITLFSHNILLIHDEKKQAKLEASFLEKNVFNIWESSLQ